MNFDLPPYQAEGGGCKALMELPNFIAIDYI